MEMIKTNSSENKSIINIVMDNLIDINDELWFYDYKINAICKTSYSSGDVSIACFLSAFNFDLKTRKIYGKIIAKNNKIFVMPEWNVPIAVYDIKADSIEYIEYKIDSKKIVGKIFSSIISSDEFIYFFPYAYDYILKLNSYTGEMTYISLGEKSVNNCEYERISWDCCSEFDDCVLFTSLQSQKVMKLDLCSDEITTAFSIDECNPASICKGRGCLYVIDMESNKIYKYLNDGFILEKIIPIEYRGYKHGSNNRIIDSKDNIFLLGRVANMCLAFDKNTENIRCLAEYNDLGDECYPKSSYFSNVLFYMDNYYLFINGQKEVLVYDNKMSLVNKKIFTIMKKDLLAILNSQISTTVKETETLNLALLLEAINQ